MNKLICATLTIGAASAFFVDPELDSRTSEFSTRLSKTVPVTHITLSDCLNPTVSKVDVCPLHCTNQAIALYWACAADCVEKLAQNWCITEICQAKVVAFDVPCLKKCPPAEYDSFLQ